MNFATIFIRKCQNNLTEKSQMKIHTKEKYQHKVTKLQTIKIQKEMSILGIQ